MPHSCTMPEHGQPSATAPCCRPRPAAPAPAAPPPAATWRRTLANTAVCLLGCTIGDVGVVVASWLWFPHAAMWLVMPLAIVAGLATSLALETAWLMRRGQRLATAWRLALGMSFGSMLAMELAMNLVDLGLTGGNRMHLSFGDYLGILALGEVAGFVLPLPYNHWRLQHGHSCH